MADIRDILSKEYGGIPVWVFAIVIGGGVGLYLRHRSKSASSSSSTLDPQQQAALSDNSGAYGAIDPNTGIPYSLETSGMVGSTMGGGAADSGMTGPTPQQEVADVTGLISALQPILGLGAGAGSAPQAPQVPIDLAPGDSVYDPATGKIITAPGGGGGQSADTSSVPVPHTESPIRRLPTPTGQRMSSPYSIVTPGKGKYSDEIRITEYGRSGKQLGVVIHSKEWARKHGVKY